MIVKVVLIFLLLKPFFGLEVANVPALGHSMSYDHGS
jgi:hypothetical protein